MFCSEGVVSSTFNNSAELIEIAMYILFMDLISYATGIVSWQTHYKHEYTKRKMLPVEVRISKSQARLLHASLPCNYIRCRFCGKLQ
jgi:hypothetical protein